MPAAYLASGVPDLKLDLLSAHFDDSGAKLDANSDERTERNKMGVSDQNKINNKTISW